jgi:hypothetical protein
MPELAAAQAATPQAAAGDTPHDSYDFWNGFFDSVNPLSQNYGQKSATRGPADQLPDPAAETQYLHYKADTKLLRYATDIGKDELLDHDGDVAVSIALSQYQPSNAGGDASVRAAQLRVDTTQIHPYMNIIAPLAWTAIASLEPNKAGKVSLEQLGFKAPQAQQGTSKIMLTQGTGKLSVNVSKAAKTSVFGGSQDGCSAGHLAGHQCAGAQRFYRGVELLGGQDTLHHGRQPDHSRGDAAGNERSGPRRSIYRFALRRLPDGSAEAH